MARAMHASACHCCSRHGAYPCANTLDTTSPRTLAAPPLAAWTRHRDNHHLGQSHQLWFLYFDTVIVSCEYLTDGGRSRKGAGEDRKGPLTEL